MGLAVSESSLLVVATSQKWLLTLGAHEMLKVPGLAQSVDHTVFHRAPACPTDGNAHLVMASQTVELSCLFPCLHGQLHPAAGAVEVVGVVRLTPVLDVPLLN
ncbi:hypothetical protein NP493_233g03016 [Ridgeia piscesae]|uniref:Uncharacterized protein n=1 Tax=Ridgeia piscesae TaxID=27915 RepID=A0AAD9UDM4_RIDPI|nr:hypothetical protein NP493_233g03016 [Ridgeia piscesae]